MKVFDATTNAIGASHLFEVKDIEFVHTPGCSMHHEAILFCLEFSMESSMAECHATSPAQFS